MAFRILAVLAVASLICGAAAQDQNSIFSPLSSDHHSRGIGQSVSGYVRSVDGQPIRDARVEVRELPMGHAVASGYTNFGGAFDFDGLPRGQYEVVAVSGLQEARERVTLEGGDSTVVLRFSEAQASAGGDKFSVSLAQMKIPDKARNLFKKAEEAMRKQKLEDAGKFVEEALKASPGFAEALTLRGILKLDADHLDAARDDMEKAVESDGNYGFGYVALGAVYNRLSRFDDALRVLDRGIGLSPKLWQGYFEMSKAFLAKSDYDACLRQLNKAEDLSPKYSLIHLVRAHALLGMKNYPEAMSELEVYLEKEPTGQMSLEARNTLEKVRAFTANNKK